MSNALMRGRKLDKGLAELAHHDILRRKHVLMGKLRSGKISIKERRELRWKYGVKEMVID